MNIQIGEFMHKKYLFVWGDHEGYAYNEYMLISGMLITRVCCTTNPSTTADVSVTTDLRKPAHLCIPKVHAKAEPPRTSGARLPPTLSQHARTQKQPHRPHNHSPPSRQAPLRHRHHHHRHHPSTNLCGGSYNDSGTSRRTSSNTSRSLDSQRQE